MTAILNRFVSLFKTNGLAAAKPLQAAHKNGNSIDTKVQSVAKESIKQTNQLGFFESITDKLERNKLRNSYNIFAYMLNTDLNKQKMHSKDLKVAIDYCIKKANTGKVTEDECKEINAFFDKMSSQPEEIFNRTELLGGQIALQRILSSELANLLDQQKNNPEIVTNTHYKLNLAIAKAKLAVKVGQSMKAAGSGVNGAQLVKDLEGNYVGVFKPKPTTKWYQLGECLKKYFGQARLLNQKDELGQQFAEVAAHQFDELMGFNLAPAATMAELKGQEGAFLAFLPGYKELADCEKQIESRKSYTPEEIEKWQLMCVYNFLVGNMDPHNENIFVKMDKNNHLTEVRMIDHGNCFIEYNPGEIGSIGNQGQWGRYKISNEAFQPKTLEFIRNNLTEAKLDTFVNTIGTQRNQFWTIRMDHLQRQRLSVIRNAVLNGEIRTPKELARLHTTMQLDKYAQTKVSNVKTEENTEIGNFAVLDI